MIATFRLITHLVVAAVASLFLFMGSVDAMASKDTWIRDVRQTVVGGFIVGSAEAPMKIVEYVSYTCPHCAHFETEEMSKLGNGVIASGKANIEIRNYWRDGIDVTIAMLARCGGPTKFFANHRYLMSTQAQWRVRANQVKPETAILFNAEYGTGDYVELDGLVHYVNGVFDDMQLASLLTPMKITPVAARACLSDKAALRQILKMTDEGIIDYGVSGTPTFLFNGIKDETVGDFATIKNRVDRG